MLDFSEKIIPLYWEIKDFLGQTLWLTLMISSIWAYGIQATKYVLSRTHGTQKISHCYGADHRESSGSRAHKPVSLLTRQTQAWHWQERRWTKVSRTFPQSLHNCLHGSEFRSISAKSQTQWTSFHCGVFLSWRVCIFNHGRALEMSTHNMNTFKNYLAPDYTVI